MKISCLHENLAKGLNIVGRAVASRSTLPILANVLLSTDKAGLKLSATNLEMGITCWIGAKVHEEGSTTLPAKTLIDLVGTLPKDRIDLSLDSRTQTMQVACAEFTNEIKKMCPNINVVRLDNPKKIFNEYKKAIGAKNNRSTILVEYGDYYNEK